MTWKTLKGGDPAAKQTKRTLLLLYGKICHAVTLYEICVVLVEADLFDALDSNAVRRVDFSISSGFCSLWFPLIKGPISLKESVYAVLYLNCQRDWLVVVWTA